MEESALRLVQILAGDPELRIHTYVLSLIGGAERPAGAERMVDIASQVSGHVELLGPLTVLNARERAMETSRLQVLFLTQAISKVVSEYPSAKHVLLSFYLPSVGFALQYTAESVGLLHIACSRGSDLGRDVFTHEEAAAIDWVLDRASCVVTTNLEHEAYVLRRVRPTRHVKTVYNAVPEHMYPRWKRSSSSETKLVSLGGYSLKKGTHILLNAVAMLLEEGLPITLDIAGMTGTGDWDRLRGTFNNRYGSSFRFHGFIPRGEVETFLLNGDLFCSASLSEGCANATMLAICLGMPVASTATGALSDFAGHLDHVVTAAPGRQDDFTGILRKQVTAINSGMFRVSQTQVRALTDRLSIEKERHEWKTLFHAYGSVAEDRTVKTVTRV